MRHSHWKKKYQKKLVAVIVNPIMKLQGGERYEAGQLTSYAIYMIRVIR